MRSRGSILALDQGGGSSRALLFDLRGRLLSEGRRRVEHQRPADDRVEQDPEELISSLHAACAEALEQGPEPPQPIVAGLATQRSSLVCWDRITGAALSPVLSWQDRRAAAELEELELDRDWIRGITGLLPSPYYGASKMRWCLDHLPEVRSALDDDRLALGPLASFLAFRLCKNHPYAVDPANAQRTLLFDPKTLDWSTELCDRFKIPQRLLPKAQASDGSWGLLDGIPDIDLRLVTGDQGAAIFANGAPSPDSVYINLGTGAFLQRPIGGNEAGAPDGLLMGVIAHREGQAVRVVEGTVNGAASALDLVGGELGFDRPAHQLESVWPTVSEPPLFLNGVSGLASPYWVSDFPTGFVNDQGGASEARSAEARLVAVAESILFLIAVNLDRMTSVGTKPRRLIVTGGLSQIGRLCQSLADLAQLPVDRPDETEATARGTAWLAAGGPADWQIATADRFAPKPNDALRARFRRWREAMGERLIRKVV